LYGQRCGMLISGIMIFKIFVSVCKLRDNPAVCQAFLNVSMNRHITACIQENGEHFQHLL
ncbi:hypothetical protein EAG_09539, partial [Camponotus floridanus]